MQKKQALNPYLPSWEYIPDGEPYVFGDRVYVYGSHDLSKGHVFCLGDYVCWSAPVDDLGNWRYEGVIYPKTSDPFNKDGKMCLYAPDVTIGPDGRYYLYYVLDKVSVVSVAVCDTPAGKYEFLGYVHYEDGTRLGDKPGDEPQFDPGVLTEGENTYLYTGFCGRGDKSRTGAFVTVLGPDMLTIKEAPKRVAPGCEYSEGTSFVGHEYFEAASIRKIGDTYYFIYSSQQNHELCYATSQYPDRDFVFGGTIVSNGDVGIHGRTEADRLNMTGTTHGSIECINGQWYVFYHRLTHKSDYSRQACAERIKIAEDGSIAQVEITSCGLNGAPLRAEGTYPAVIVCNITNGNMPHGSNSIYTTSFPNVTHSGEDRFIGEVCGGTLLGWKYFDFADVTALQVTLRGEASGTMSASTQMEGAGIGSAAVSPSENWTQLTIPFTVTNGTHALYLRFEGTGLLDVLEIGFIR